MFRLGSDNGCFEYRFYKAVFGTFDYKPIAELWKLSQPCSTCPVQWTGSTLGIQCLDCQLDPSVICLACFFGGDHTKHKIKLVRTSRGCCDCGDVSGCKPEGFCKRHSGINAVTDSAAVLESLPSSLPSVPNFVSNVKWVLKQIDVELSTWLGEEKQLERIVSDNEVQRHLITCLNCLTELASISPAFQYLIGKHVLYESRVREFLDANLQLPKVVSDSFDQLVLVVAGLPSYKMIFAKIVFEELPSMIEKQRERCCAADKTISAYLRQFCTMMVQIFTVPEVANEAFSKCLAVKLVQEFEKIVVLWGEKKNLVDERPKKKCLALLSMCSDVLVYLLRASCPESFQTEGSLRSILNLFATIECLSHQTRRRISHVRIDQFNRSLFHAEEKILSGIIHQSIYWEIPINVKPSSVIKRMNSSLKCQDMAIRIIKKSFAEGSLHWEDFTFQNSLPRFIAATFCHQLFKSALTKSLPVSITAAAVYPLSLLALFDVQFLSELLFVAVRQLTAECEIDKNYWTRNGLAAQLQRAFYLQDTARRPSWDAKLVVFCLCLINLHQKSQAQPIESETNRPGEGPWGLKLLLHLFFPSVCPFCTHHVSSGTNFFCFSEAYQDDRILDDDQIDLSYPTHKKIIGARFFSSAMRCPLSVTSFHRLIATSLFSWDVDDKRLLPETAVRLRREMERRSASGLGFRLFCFWRIIGFVCHSTQQMEHVNELNEPFSLISASALSSDLSSFDPDERSSIESLPAEYRVSCASESAAAQLSAPSLFPKLSRAILQAGGSCSGGALWDSLDGSILDNCGFEEALSLVADTKKSSSTACHSLSRLGISFADLWQPRYYSGSIAKQTPSEYLLNECSKFPVEDSKAPLPSLLGPWRSDYRSVCKPDVFSYVMSSIDFYLSHSVSDSCSGAAHLLSQMVLDVFTLSLESSADERFLNWKRCLSSCVEELERQNVESEIIGNVRRVLEETKKTDKYISRLPMEESFASSSLKTSKRYSSPEDFSIWYSRQEVEQMATGSTAFSVKWMVELQRLAEDGLKDAKKETPEVRRKQLRKHLLEMREDVVAASLKVLVSGVMMLWDRKYDENNKADLSSFDIDDHLECDKQSMINALENLLKKQNEDFRVCGELEPHLLWAINSAVKKLKGEQLEGKGSLQVESPKNEIHQDEKISEDDQNDETSLIQKRKAELRKRQMLIQSHFSKQIGLISESLTSDGIEVYDSKSTFPAPATNIDEEIQMEKAPKGLFFGRLDSVEGFLTRYFKKLKTDSQFSFSEETRDALSWHNDTESICVICRTGSSSCRPLCSLIYASPSNSLRRLNYPLVSSPESNNPNLYRASITSLAENRLYPFMSASIASCGHQAHYSCLMDAHRQKISKCPLCRFRFNHSLPNIPNCSGLQFMSSTLGSGYYGTQESSVADDSSGLLSLAEVESQIQRTLNWKEDSDEHSTLALGMAGPVLELGLWFDKTRMQFQPSGLEISRMANLDHDSNGANDHEGEDMSVDDGGGNVDLPADENNNDDIHDNINDDTNNTSNNTFDDPRNNENQIPPDSRNAEINIASEEDRVEAFQIGEELPSPFRTPFNNPPPDKTTKIHSDDYYSTLESYGASEDFHKKLKDGGVSSRLKDGWLPPKRLTDQIQSLIGDESQDDLAKHWEIPEVSFLDLSPEWWITCWRVAESFYTYNKRDSHNLGRSSLFWFHHSLYRNDSPLLWVVLTQLLLVSRCNLPVVLQTKTPGGPKHVYVHLIRLIWFFGLQNIFKTDQQHQSDVDYWIPNSFIFKPDPILPDVKTRTPCPILEINSPWLADVRVEFLRQFLKAPKVHCEGSNPNALLVFRTFVKKMIKELTALNALQTIHALVVEFVRRILTERKFKKDYHHSCVINDETVTESSTPKSAIQFVCDDYSPYEPKKKIQKCEKSPPQQPTRACGSKSDCLLSESSMREIMATFLSCVVDKLKGTQTTLAAPHSAAADFEDLAIRLAWWRLGHEERRAKDNNPSLRDNKAMKEDDEATSACGGTLSGGAKVENKHPSSLSDITEDDKLVSFCDLLCALLVLFDNECATRTITSDGCCVGQIGQMTLEKAFQRERPSGFSSLDSLIAVASLKLEFRQFRSTPGPGFASRLDFSGSGYAPRMLELLVINFRTECGKDSGLPIWRWFDCIIETFREYLPLPPLLFELINFPFDSDGTSCLSSTELEGSLTLDSPCSLLPTEDGGNDSADDYDFNLHSYFDFLCNAVREQFEIDDKDYRRNVELFWRQEAEPSLENVTEPLLTFFSVAITALWNLEDCDYNSIVNESSNMRTRLNQLCQVLLLGDVFSDWADSQKHEDRQIHHKGSSVVKTMAAMMWHPRIIMGTRHLRLFQTYSSGCLPLTVAGSLDVPLPPGGPSQWRDDLSASFSIPNIREQMQKKITIGKLPSLLPIPFLPSDSISALRRFFGAPYVSQYAKKQTEIPIVCLICGELHQHYCSLMHGASCGGGESFHANFYTLKFKSEIETLDSWDEAKELIDLRSWSRPLPYLTEFGETDEKLKRGCITHLDHASLELTIREHLLGKIQRGTETYMEIDFLQDQGDFI